MPKEKHPRILFLARRFPPSVGGIQTTCYHLYKHISAQYPVKLVALGKQSTLHLSWFIPYAFLVAFFQVLFRRVDVVFFSDGVICVLAPFLKPFSKARFVVTIYGLEVTYQHPVNTQLMKWGFAACERIATISQHSKNLIKKFGEPAEKVDVIYLGVEPPELLENTKNTLKTQFEKTHNLKLGHDKILLNFGRQVPRKGIAAFLEKGVPLLDPDITLLISGHGPETETIERIHRKMNLNDRIKLIYLNDEMLAMLRGQVDLFLMPNIPYPGDAEGFGIAPLECMYDGTPVVAFAVDALTESVQKGGYLIPPNDYRTFVDQIHAFFKMSPEERSAIKQEAREYVRTEYTWTKTAKEYFDFLKG